MEIEHIKVYRMQQNSSKTEVHCEDACSKKQESFNYTT